VSKDADGDEGSPSQLGGESPRVASEGGASVKSAPSHRVLRRLVIALVGVVLFAAGALVMGVARVEESEQVSEAAQHRALEAETAQARLLSETALDALRAGDTWLAAQRANASLRFERLPLAIGVQMMTIERGVPERRWRSPVEAGCLDLATRASVVACATLHGVELFDAVTGAPFARLRAGPASGWVTTVAMVDDLVFAGAENRTLFIWKPPESTPVSTEVFEAPVVGVVAMAPGVLVALQNGSLWLRASAGKRTQLPSLPSRPRALAASVGRWASSGDQFLMEWQGLQGRLRLDRGVSAVAFDARGRLVAGAERSVLVFDDAAAPRVLTGHLDNVTALAASEQLIASADAEGALRLWFWNGGPMAQWRAFAPGIRAVRWSFDETMLFVAARDRGLEAWSAPPLPKTPFHDETPTACAIRNGRALVGLLDGRLQSVDIASRKVETIHSKRQSPVRAIAMGASSAEVWATEEGQLFARMAGEAQRLDDHGVRPTALAVSPDGKRAAWAFDDGTLTLWAIEEGTAVRRMRGVPVRAIAFAPNSTRWVVGRDDKTVAEFNADDGTERTQLGMVEAPMVAVHWSVLGLIAGLSDGQMVAWSSFEGRMPRTLGRAGDRIRSVAQSPNGTRVAFGSDDGHLYVWDRASEALVAEVPVDGGAFLCVVATDDGQLGAITEDRAVHHWLLPPQQKP
jgi:WD40 repeat protein